YLVLEYIAGRTLGDLLKECGRLGEPLALAILAEAARALAEAHERGIVHRDLKPDNILLTGVRGQGSGVSSEGTAAPLASSRLPTINDLPGVKVLDFGLARHVVETESLNVTRAGAILGTPLYMAPEQCSGSGTVDARTDIYALGATLFHLLAGRPPFEGPTAVRVIAQHCQEPPPPLQQLNPAVSEGACQIAARALAKSPDARYAHAGALLHDLERLLRGEPSSIAVHPRLPACDPGRVLQYDFRWELEAGPRQLWPHVSNTERLNRAIGL